MDDILLFDATLRDGSHAIKHQLDESIIERYCCKIDNAGLDGVIVGHGNGLGASSLQVGISKCSDSVLLKAARKSLVKTKLGIYMIPGFGTIEDDLEPAIEIGVDFFKIGCHCTEADTTKQHISFLSKKGLKAYGVLMMTHMADPEKLLEEAQKMESYGASGIILMDSAGALLPFDVKERVSLLSSKLPINIGFHGHNNLSLAVANTLVALESGAKIVDGTLGGFGAGAGNCQLEIISAILQRNRKNIKIDLYKLFDISDNFIREELGYTSGIDPLTVVGGLSGVFSAFTSHIKNASKQYNVDPRDIFFELGRRKVVGGQEDIVVDVAMNIAQRQKKDDSNYSIESLLP